MADRRHGAWLARELEKAVEFGERSMPGEPLAAYVLGWLLGQTRLPTERQDVIIGLCLRGRREREVPDAR